MLDKKRPFGQVHGEGVAGAKWIQDGHYYAVDGSYLFSNPGVEAPPNHALRTLEEAEAVFREQEAMLLAASAPPANAIDEKRAAALSELTYFELDRMIKTLGGPEIKGRGAKEKMIQWLLTAQD